ncbi:hypothetical protein KEM48_011031 [Puccinia striiformis f. sp. tritici PST-130]|nr:hypothetical protein KEM48_011031 [Puccinia striiformis f. sp. tritici PST-130]
MNRRREDRYDSSTGSGSRIRRKRRRKHKKILHISEKVLGIDSNNDDKPTTYPPPPPQTPSSKLRSSASSHHKVGTLDGVGIGAVNMYLVVFRDGIISFHFENLQKHIDRVKERIHSFSTKTGHVSPHWIAYGLMDSIVDEFFPVLELIESETDLIEEYLISDPIMSRSTPTTTTTTSSTSSSTRKSKRRQRRREKRLNSNNGGRKMKSDISEGLKSDSMIDRSRMLNRITLNRRLVISLARLIAQKHQTVEALRKRMSVDNQIPHTSRINHEKDCKSKEIGLYLDDLQDHILGLSQSLSFYDTLLSNAHSTYLGILRVGLNLTKQSQDEIIIRLYLITLIVLPMTTLIGFFSMNIHIPANGDMENHKLEDGSQAPFVVFGAVVTGCLVLGVLFFSFIWKFILSQSDISFNRSFLKLFHFL